MTGRAARTRERILNTSLALFNDLGEPRVTTNQIADETDISPGNLYYHFHNKDEIVFRLFERFESRIQETLVTPETRAPDMEDMWLYLHLIFEIIWEYRFLYRDLPHLLGRDRKLHNHFRRIIDRKIATARAICEGLVASGVMEASPEEIQAVAENIALVATQWLTFQGIRHRNAALDQELGRGVYQVISLVVPYLRGEARALLNQLSRVYLI
mgnify:CR=1 FL=1